MYAIGLYNLWRLPRLVLLFMTGFFSLTTKRQKKLQKFFSAVAIFSLFLQIGSGIFYARPVFSEDVVEPTSVVEQPVETPQETVTVSESTPTPEVSPSPESTPTVEAPVEVIPTPVDEVTPTPTPTENNDSGESTTPPQETGPPLDLEKPIEDPVSGKIAPTPTPIPIEKVCLTDG